MGFYPAKTHPECGNYYEDTFLISNCLHIDFEYAHGKRDTDQLYMIWLNIYKNGEEARIA